MSSSHLLALLSALALTLVLGAMRFRLRSVPDPTRRRYLVGTLIWLLLLAATKLLMLSGAYPFDYGLASLFFSEPGFGGLILVLTYLLVLGAMAAHLPRKSVWSWHWFSIPSFLLLSWFLSWWLFLLFLGLPYFR